MMLSECVVGDTVFYLLPRAPSNGRPTDQYLEARVQSVGKKMVRIQPKCTRHSRNAAPQHLVMSPPEGAVIRLQRLVFRKWQDGDLLCAEFYVTPGAKVQAPKGWIQAKGSPQKA